MEKNRLGLMSTTSFVVANMVGTGVFTSLGFQLLSTNNIIAVVLLWVLGGILAICGALVYSELGVAMPRSGGEYNFLSKIYSQKTGFLSGWISITVGFPAPIALACMALGKYAGSVWGGINPQYIAVGALLAITLIHTRKVTFGGKFQLLFTTLKLGIIGLFIISGFIWGKYAGQFSADFSTFSFSTMSGISYSISLIYVMYAYSGWNAATYITDEIDNPRRTLPRALLLGTIVVACLYVLLNCAFLMSAPKESIAGQVEVGVVAAQNLFGCFGAKAFGAIISFLLISTISSMVFVGPRVAKAMGQDMKALGFLAKTNKNNAPVFAIGIQFVISLALILSASFESVLVYSGFILNAFSLLTVVGLYVHRRNDPESHRSFKAWGYPFTLLLYALVTLATLVFISIDKPEESAFGLLFVLVGLLVHYIVNKKRDLDI